MNYTLFIKPIDDESKSKIIAKKIASQHQELGYRDILILLKSRGFKYLKTENVEEIKKISEEFSALGVKFTISSDDDVKSHKAEKLPPVAKIEEPHKRNKIVGERLGNISTKSKKSSNLPHIYSHKKAVKKSIGAVGTTLIFIAIITALFIVLRLSNQKPSFGTGNRKSEAVDTKSSKRKSSSRVSKKSKIQNAYNGTKITAAEAETAVASAEEACGNNSSQAVKLFRFAISFNKHNLNAWYGLLNCYLENDQFSDAERIREEMREIFGDDIFSLSAIILPYGDVKNFSTEEQVCRISFRSTSKDKNQIYVNLFNIARGVASTGKFIKIIIFAEVSKGDGVLAALELGQFPETLEEFKLKSGIK